MPTDGPAGPDDRRGRRGLPITLVLAGSMGGLAVVAVAVVLFISMRAGIQNNRELLGEQARLVIDTTVARIGQHLSPAENAAAYLAEQIALEAIDPGDERDFGRVLTGAMAPAPQIRALAFIDSDYRLLGMDRRREGLFLIARDMSRPAEPLSAPIREAVDRMATTEAAEWGPPLYLPEAGVTVLNLSRPVRRGGAYLGIVVVTVSVSGFSQWLSEAGDVIGGNAFILHDRDSVLAHMALGEGYPGLDAGRPLPAVDRFADPVLAAIHREDHRMPLDIDGAAGLEGHVMSLFGELYVFIWREVAGWSDRPWQVGVWYPADDVDDSFERMRLAFGVGVGVALLAVLVAILLGRGTARPVRRLARAARRVGRLEIDGLAALPRSRIREIDEQVTAFNAMIQGLRWFETYVPKALVRRLIAAGDDSVTASRDRQVTVMFTDIAGFTAMSEGLPAQDVASFLNEHFALVAACIEAEGGTVDKFIGDAVMAFWGAPDRQKGRAVRACRAGLAIVRAVEADNARRRARGRQPLRMRIGIHSGPVTVGNIGAPGRMNYTIVGDTVNTAQRLEGLCRELCGEAEEAAVLISATTAADLDADFAAREGATITPVGESRLRGREAALALFRLQPAETEAVEPTEPGTAGDDSSVRDRRPARPVRDRS